MKTKGEKQLQFTQILVLSETNEMFISPIKQKQYYFAKYNW